MKHTHYLVAASTAAALLMSAGIASADSDARGTDRGLHIGAFIGLGTNAALKAEWNADREAAREKRLELNARLQSARGANDRDERGERRAVSGEVTAMSGTTLTLTRGDETFTVDAANADVRGGAVADISLGDHLVVKGRFDGTVFVAERILDTTLLRAMLAERMSLFRIGEVTTIAGSVFTIDPRGDKDVVTVTTDANTVFRLNGAATSASALSVGQRVILTGTTTASSSDAEAFSASIVDILTEGFKKLRHWIWSR